MTKKEEKQETKTIHQAFVDAQKGFGKALKTSSVTLISGVNTLIWELVLKLS
jgi:hypothetical protein